MRIVRHEASTRSVTPGAIWMHIREVVHRTALGKPPRGKRLAYNQAISYRRGSAHDCLGNFHGRVSRAETRRGRSELFSRCPPCAAAELPGVPPAESQVVGARPHHL